MNPKLSIKLDIAQGGTRVDHALKAELQAQAPGLSRSTLKEWFKEGRVLLNGKKVTASHELRTGPHKIEIKDWHADALTPAAATPSTQGSFLPVVYEDEDILVLNKLSGIPSMPHQSDETETAVGSALARFPALKGVGKKPLEPGLLHRLDTGTSGLLAFAKSSDEFDRLRLSWKDGSVRKLYRAIVEIQNRAPEPPLMITTPLGHDEKSAKRMRALPPGENISIRGKPLPAKTRIISCRPVAGRNFDLHVEIFTGVMHQIRCHLSSMGWPVFGDPIYSNTTSSRLWLHHWRLSLPLKSGRPLQIEAPLPDGWGTG